MADLTPKQLDLLKERFVYLEDKPCPGCGTLDEKMIITEQFQIFSQKIDNGIIRRGDMSYAPLGIIKCPRCGYAHSFMLPLD